MQSNPQRDLRREILTSPGELRMAPPSPTDSPIPTQVCPSPTQAQGTPEAAPRLDDGAPTYFELGNMTGTPDDPNGRSPKSSPTSAATIPPADTPTPLGAQRWSGPPESAPNSMAPTFMSPTDRRDSSLWMQDSSLWLQEDAEAFESTPNTPAQWATNGRRRPSVEARAAVLDKTNQMSLMNNKPPPPSEAEVKFSLREILAEQVRNNMWGWMMGILVTVLSLLSVVLYVVASYLYDVDDDIDEDYAALVWLDRFFDAFFLVDYLLLLYIADDRFEHATRPTTIADFLSVLPLLGFLFSNFKVLSIFRFFRCVRILKLYRLQGHVTSEASRTSRQLFMLAFTTGCFLFVSAGMIHATDVLWDGGQYAGIEAGHTIQFHEAMYLLVVTITTVGYGDIAPQEDVSRMLLTGIILAGFAILPRQVAKLNSTLQERSKYFTRFKPHNKTWKHIVVVGPPTSQGVSAVTIETVLNGFMHEETGDIKMHIVVLSPFEPTSDIKILLEHRMYETRLTYIKGTVVDDEAMVRARAPYAEAFFVCVNKYDSVQMAHEEDMEAIVSTLAVKRFKDDMRVIVELNTAESKAWLDAYHLPGVQTMCLEELRNGMLAHSCLHPGLSTMLMNFVQTHNNSKTDDIGPDDPAWLHQYLWGASQQLYEIDISICKGMAFCMAVEFLMERFQLMLIAVQEKSTTTVWRNPGNLYIIREGDTGFVLSHNRLSHRAIVDLPSTQNQEVQEHIAKMRSGAAEARQRSILRVPKASIQDSFSPNSARTRNSSRAKLPSSASVSAAEAEAAEAVSVQRVKVQLKGHIVVLGSVHGSRSFIEPLRVKQSRSEDITQLRPIVIVGPETNLGEINAVLSAYSQVFHITGSPLDKTALEMAAVAHAERVVILRDSSMSQRWGLLHNRDVQGEDQMQIIDAENVFCYRQVLEACAHRQDLPIIELIHMPNMRFLSMNPYKCPHDDKYYRWPLYSAGQVVSTTTFDTLFTHVFLFPGMLEMFSTLAHRSRIPEARCFQVHDSGFLCVPVPAGFSGTTFGIFFNYCLGQREAICLGLYRYAMEDPKHPFVFTNPHPNELLLRGDHAFFLALPGFKLTDKDVPEQKAIEAAKKDLAEKKETLRIRPKLDEMTLDDVNDITLDDKIGQPAQTIETVPENAP